MVVIQQYETVLLAILTMVIIKQNNNNQHCSRLISFFCSSLRVSYTVSIALYLILRVRVRVCVISFFSLYLSYIRVLIFPNVNIALLRVGALAFLYSSFYLFYLYLDIKSLKTKKKDIEMITFHYLLKNDIEPAAKIISLYIYIYIYTLP